MSTATLTVVPVDDSITIAQLTKDPYPIYRRLRAEAPVVRVSSLGRIFVTKAADTKYIKENWELFSSDDPSTPMTRAMQAHTLMRKDGEPHKRERNAMATSFSPRNVKGCWHAIFAKVCEEYVGRLPRGETVDLFTDLAAPFAARCLTHFLGIPEASDAQMIRWSQTLIDGSGNFSGDPQLFARTDAANVEMDALFGVCAKHKMRQPDQTALSVMVNAAQPIETSQIFANLKVAIGGGINEPRDALLTVLYGLLTNPDQRDACIKDEMWDLAFEEGVRWVAPIQIGPRLAATDTEIRGLPIAKGEVVMTLPASACHDEDLYDAPEFYNIFRPRQPHYAFGSGPHFCQGAHVARRMIAQIMLPMLFDRFPNMHLPEADKIDFSGFAFRGPLSLPVTLN